MNSSKATDEKQAIQQAIMDYYHEGHVQSDPKLYEPILHPEWKFFLFDEQGNLRIVDRTEYMSWYDPENANSALDWETEFYKIDVTENIAQVKLRIECQEVKYIDYFNMMNINGQWQIVHKMSHGKHKGETN
jgi:hypothetical protein